MKKVILASVVASIAASSAFAGGGTAPGTNPATQATATSVVLESSADVKWEGTVSDLPDGCLFTKNENGKMRYTEDALGGGVWEVFQKAVVDVRVRGEDTSLSVEADSAVVRVGGDIGETTNSHDMYDVTVDYAGGAMPSVLQRSYYVDSNRDNTAPTDIMATYSPGKIDMIPIAVGKSNTLELGGTATMNNPNALIDNGDYELRHKVTCLQ